MIILKLLVFASSLFWSLCYIVSILRSIINKNNNTAEQNVTAIMLIFSWTFLYYLNTK